MAGPDSDAVARVVARREERQTVTVVKMRMREKQIEIMRLAALLQRVAEQAQPRAAVEDEQLPAAADFDARRIAAIACRGRPRHLDAAAHAPEPDDEVGIWQKAAPALCFLS